MFYLDRLKSREIIPNIFRGGSPRPLAGIPYPPVSVCPNEEPTSRHRTNSHKNDSESESRVKFMTVRERKVYRVEERDCEQLLRF